MNSEINPFIVDMKKVVEGKKNVAFQASPILDDFYDFALEHPKFQLLSLTWRPNAKSKRFIDYCYFFPFDNYSMVNELIEIQRQTWIYSDRKTAHPTIAPREWNEIEASERRMGQILSYSEEEINSYIDELKSIRMHSKKIRYQKNRKDKRI